MRSPSPSKPCGSPRRNRPRLRRRFRLAGEPRVGGAFASIFPLDHRWSTTGDRSSRSPSLILHAAQAHRALAEFCQTLLVEIDIDEEGAQSAEQREQRRPATRLGFRTEAEKHRSDGDGEDAGTRVLPARRHNRDRRIDEELMSLDAMEDRVPQERAKRAT